MNIFLVTSRPLFFGREKKGWESLDLTSMQSLFSTLGNLRIINIDQLLLINFESSDIIIVGSDPDLKQHKYHIDILEFIQQKYKLILYPNLSLLKAHENKGYQELLKNRLELNSLNGYYLNSIESLDLISISYPVVYKNTTGAGSTGVSLAQTREELENIIKKSIHISFMDKLKLLVRKFQYPTKLYQQYSKSKLKINPFILQPFIPNLKYDYKVLCFGDKYYSLKRFVRNHDFRASGSGKIKFEKPSISLVQYAKEIQILFNTPVISLDICWDGERYYLIEFQACHFGPSTLTKSIGYYQYDNDWNYIEEASNLTTEFCNAYINDIKNATKQ